MAILTARNLSQHFGGFTVFSNVHVSIPHGSRIGLVGPNGIGKTTLLLILAGLAEPSYGSVSRAQNIRLGYLRQEAMQAFSEQTHTVMEEMLSVFTGIQAQEARMRQLEVLMGDPEADFDAVMEEYSALHDEFERIGGYDYEVRIQQTLGGLGFHEQEYDLPLSHLSGGQKTRALLARLLLERPHLLILDEPTNHLDVNAIEWLEKTLNNWDGSLLIVSHDRFFLDRVTTVIWEMSREGVEAYRGNYSAYVQQREERHEYHMKLYEQERERLLNELDYIKRNIARASTNGMAVGRLRRLSRDLAGIEQLGLAGYLSTSSWSETGVGGVRPLTVAEADKAIKAIPKPVKRTPKLNLDLKYMQRSGEIVLKTREVEVGYPDKFLFTSDDIRLERGECAALIGGNGTGKTTLLKTITEEIAPLAGKVYPGMNLKIGYFAQAHDGLNLENTVLDELTRHKPMMPADARNYLAQYLFRGDDVFKKVGDLSGGERAKLAMALLALQGANFLLLDEPTNHLDIAAQEVLQEVLEQFEGTVLLVTHDRYLVNRLATQIWHVENQHLRVFNGTYQEYLEAREREKAEGKAYRAEVKRQERAEKVNGKRPDVTKLEAQIHALESSMNELATLIERAKSGVDAQRLSQQYAESQAKLDELMGQWESLAIEPG
jgi:ATP-binding cassette, subfamily F, member 3